VWQAPVGLLVNFYGARACPRNFSLKWRLLADDVLCFTEKKELWGQQLGRVKQQRKSRVVSPCPTTSSKPLPPISDRDHFSIWWFHSLPLFLTTCKPASFPLSSLLRRRYGARRVGLREPGNEVACKRPLDHGVINYCGLFCLSMY